MFFKKSLQWWTGVVLACLMMSLVLFAYVARKPLCIDSKIVEKIDSLSQNTRATAYRCGLHQHVDYDETLANQTRDLGRRLQRLERFLDWVGPLKSRIHLTIFSEAPFHFAIFDHRIEISEALLRAQGQLEKAILKIWFAERAHLSVRENLLAEESWTDLLYVMFSGSLDLQDPVTGIFLNEDQTAKWPRVLSTTKGYCRDVWNPIQNISLCANLEELSQIVDFSAGTAADQIDLLSLRPLISQALLTAYLKLKPLEQLKLGKKISENLANWNRQDQQFGMSALSLKKQKYIESSVELEVWIQSLRKVSHPFSALFASSLRTQGFEGMGGSAELDVLIFTSEFEDKVNPKLIQALHSEFQKGQQGHFMGWIGGNQIQLGFQNERLDLEMLGDIKASRGFLFHCGKVETSTLLKAANRVEKLVYVDSCGLETTKLDEFLKKGTRGFALQNPKIKFIEFHTPSLLSALQQLPEINPILALSLPDQRDQFLKILGWTDPLFDKGAGAYRAQSVINAIDWYRL